MGEKIDPLDSIVTRATNPGADFILFPFFFFHAINIVNCCISIVTIRHELNVLILFLLFGDELPFPIFTVLQLPLVAVRC